MLESLESRRLMSGGGASASLSGGVLTVSSGSSDGNAVSVTETNGAVSVFDNDTGVLTNFTGVTGIKINGQAKNDRIFYSGNTIGAQISGGIGNDEITVEDKSTSANSGASTVNGDGGNDSIVVLDANGTIVNGGGGNDDIYVSDAVDASRNLFILGMAGDDVIELHGGRNFIDGGSGQDLLILGDGTYHVAYVANVEGAVFI